jgi:negative regulator of flagellin synthesis FlgM
MKISQPIDKPAALSSNAATLAAKNGPVAGTPAKTPAPKSTQSAGVAVTMSSMARSLEAGSTGEIPDVDTAKVNAVRASIAQGTYKVNPEAIADKLLANAQEMLTRNRA